MVDDEKVHPLLYGLGDGGLGCVYGCYDFSYLLFSLHLEPIERGIAVEFADLLGAEQFVQPSYKDISVHEPMLNARGQMLNAQG